MLGALGKIAASGGGENVESNPAHVGRWSLIFQLYNGFGDSLNSLKAFEMHNNMIK